MISRVLRYNLINDVVDINPNTLVSQYPTVFTASGQVPEYLYKSLKSLWLGTSAASGDLAHYIVADTGIDQETPKGAMVIQVDTIWPGYENPFPKGAKDDMTGAEVARVSIVLYKPRIVYSPDTLYNTATRIQMILDQYYRNTRRLGMMTISGDKEVAHGSTDYVKAFHIETYGPGRLAGIEGKVMELVFRVEYRRILL